MFSFNLHRQYFSLTKLSWTSLCGTLKWTLHQFTKSLVGEMKTMCLSSTIRLSRWLKKVNAENPVMDPDGALDIIYKRSYFITVVVLTYKINCDLLRARQQESIFEEHIDRESFKLQQLCFLMLWTLSFYLVLASLWASQACLWVEKHKTFSKLCQPCLICSSIQWPINKHLMLSHTSCLTLALAVDKWLHTIIICAAAFTQQMEFQFVYFHIEL